MRKGLGRDATRQFPSHIITWLGKLPPTSTQWFPKIWSTGIFPVCTTHSEDIHKANEHRRCFPPCREQPLPLGLQAGGVGERRKTQEPKKMAERQEWSNPGLSLYSAKIEVHGD